MKNKINKENIWFHLLYTVGSVILLETLPDHFPGEWEKKQKHTYILERLDGTEELITAYLWERIR